MPESRCIVMFKYVKQYHWEDHNEVNLFPSNYIEVYQYILR